MQENARKFNSIQTYRERMSRKMIEEMRERCNGTNIWDSRIMAFFSPSQNYLKYTRL